ncbi:sugar transferase [Actibacterium sp. MT2.3-13A]|uniref:sugar transferase n=1 Tax=Actibacterium sp. MT2.3-13A TaxID=2828332 RepID=UPI001BACE628
MAVHGAATTVPLSKRVFDKVFAVAALVFFAPFILLVAAAILIADGRPVFYGHRRVGLDGRSFQCLKFRTMARNSDILLQKHLRDDPAARAEWQATRKLSRDPRVNCLGAFLRKTSLDELPQFWNVLRGEMSVVGPRPVVIEEATFYKGHFADYISVLPGVTGAWQVSGRSNTTYDERVSMDVDYVRNRSFWGDMRIVLKTVSVILTQKGAC